MQSPLLLSSLLLAAAAAQEGCGPPSLEHGRVERLDSGSDFFIGKFVCSAGFTLSGASQLKCRRGVWSSRLPVCVVSGCEVRQLAHLENGRKYKVRGSREGSYTYRCNKGYRLLGTKHVHCTPGGWSATRPAVCAKPGCPPLLPPGSFPYGRARPLLSGAALKFHCDSGAMMEGSGTVYCDGNTWNDTAPVCLVPADPPLLTALLEGEETPGPLVQPGQTVDLLCQAGGNPPPRLVFWVGGADKEVEPDSRLGDTARLAVRVDVATTVTCTAENSGTARPLVSSRVQINIRKAPAAVHVTGPAALVPGEPTVLGCHSGEARPAAQLTVTLTDQTGSELAAPALTRQPAMRAGAGLASRAEFTVTAGPGVQAVIVTCNATNTEGEAVTQRQLPVMVEPAVVELLEPVLDWDTAVLECRAGPARPAPALVWRVGEEEVAGENWLQEEAGLLVAVSRLNLTLDPEPAVVRCTAAIPELGYQASSRAVSVSLPPAPTASLTGPATFSSGQEVSLACSVDTSLAVVEWRVEDGEGKPLAWQEGGASHEGGEEAVFSLHTSCPNCSSLTATCIAAGPGGSTTARHTVLLAAPPGPLQLLGPPAPPRPGTALQFSCSVPPSQLSQTVSLTLTDQDGNTIPGQEEQEKEGEVVVSVTTPAVRSTLTATCRAQNTAGYVEESMDIAVMEEAETSTLFENEYKFFTESGKEDMYSDVYGEDYDNAYAEENYDEDYYDESAESKDLDHYDGFYEPITKDAADSEEIVLDATAKKNSVESEDELPAPAEPQSAVLDHGQEVEDVNAAQLAPSVKIDHSGSCCLHCSLGSLALVSLVGRLLLT